MTNTVLGYAKTNIIVSGINGIERIVLAGQAIIEGDVILSQTDFQNIDWNDLNLALNTEFTQELTETIVEQAMKDVDINKINLNDFEFIQLAEETTSTNTANDADPNLEEPIDIDGETVGSGGGELNSLVDQLNLTGDHQVNSDLVGTDPIIEIRGAQSSSSPGGGSGLNAGGTSDVPLPPPSISISNVFINESDGLATFTVVLERNGSTGDFSIDYKTVNNFPTMSTDFTPQDSTLTFENGADPDTQIISIAITNDNVYEPTETFLVTLQNPQNLTGAEIPINENNVAVGVIANDDPLPTIFATTNPSNILPENAGETDVIQVALSNPSQEIITVDYTTRDGSATGGADYVSKTGTVVFQPGETSVTLGLNIIDDDVWDSALSENLLIDFSNPQNATLGQPSLGLFINDNEDPPTVIIENFTITEGTTAQDVEVKLSHVSEAPIIIELTFNGAVNYANPADLYDYSVVGANPLPSEAPSISFQFNPGETTKTFAFVAEDDINNPYGNSGTFNVVEPTEYVDILLTSVDLGLIDEAIALISIDDSPLPVIGILDTQDFPNNTTVGENAGTVNDALVFTDSNLITENSSAPVSVSYTTSGTAIEGVDYNIISPANLNLNDLSSIGGALPIEIEIINDTMDENDETIIITLANPELATIDTNNNTFTFTIADNDNPPTVSFENNISVANEGQSSDVVVKLSEASGKTITIDYSFTNGTASDADYDKTGGTLTFAPGETEKTIATSITANDSTDADETFNVNLSTPSNAILGVTTEHTVTILEDAPTIFASDVTVNESEGTVTVLIESANIEFTIPVMLGISTSDDSALSTSDYVTYSGGDIELSSTKTSQEIVLTITDDNVFESPESFSLNIISSDVDTVVLTPTVNITIIDDDPLDLETSPDLITYYGAVLGDNSGTSLGYVGDIDGDGLDDIIIGAPNADASQSITNSGDGYIFFGSKTIGNFNDTQQLSYIANNSQSSRGFLISGFEETNSQTGYSVHAAGDFNGDGYDDTIISAPGADVDTTNTAGKSYIIFGGTSITNIDLNTLTLNGTNGILIDGFYADARSGASVAGGFDFNADGFDDVLLGSPNLNNMGDAYLILGSSSPTDLTLDSLGSTGTSILPSSDSPVNFGDTFGFSVSFAGDFNNDGYQDIIIGAKNTSVELNPNNNNLEEVGRTYIILGRSDISTIDISTTSSDVFMTITGAINDNLTSGGEFGFSVSDAGDVNGDGFGDIVVGAKSMNAGIGEAYIIYGTSVATTTDLNVADLTPSTGIKISGAAGTDQLGFSVSGAGDFNGDGFDDVILGAPNVDGSTAGQAFLVFGGESLSNLSVTDLKNGVGGFEIIGIDSDDLVGGAVSNAGDVNGDGYNDILISAGTADSFNTSNNDTADAGESYLIFGFDYNNTTTHQGDENNNTLTGTSGDDIMVGGRGDDTFTNYAGNNSMRGGAGDDTFNFLFQGSNAYKAVNIDGGNGIDTLKITGGIDISTLDNVSSIENLTVLSSGSPIAFDVHLDLISILNLIENNDSNGNQRFTLDSNTIKYEIIFTDSGWSDTGADVGGFDVWANTTAAPNLEVLLQQSIDVTVA